MIVLAFVLVALVLALIFKGDLRRLADVELRWWGLALAAVAIQVLASSSLGTRLGLSSIRPAVFIGSMALLIVVGARNWRLPGIALLTVGLLANTLAIGLNDGRMPVDPYLVRGALAEGTAPGVGVMNNASGSALIGPDTRLAFLCDVVPTPRWFPIHNAFSAGDVMLGVGAAWFFLAATRRRPAVAGRQPDSED
jgi:hypothetical protein